MQFDSLNADLKRWLQSSIEGGFDLERVQQAMREAGYDAGFARRAVEAAAAKFGLAAPAAAPEAAVAAQAAAVLGTGEPLTAGEPPAEAANTVATADRAVEVLMALDSPRLMLFGNLMSAEECDELIAASRRRLQRSTVVNPQTGVYDVHPDRTSRGTHFERGETPLIARLERRIAELTGCPADRGEPIQILHYMAGGEYKPHHDYFDPAQPGNDRVLAMGGQRVATLVIYLNDVAAGGATVFPALGLEVRPRRGAAVYFAYCDAAGRTDARLLHGGAPVQAGEKWIATKWLRQRRYGGPGA